MEIVGEDGTEIELQEGSDFVFGRGQGHWSEDLNVSRRHICFKLDTRACPSSSRVSFEVIGKNPVWVRRAESGEITAFRRHERGEMGIGDSFCVSAKDDPLWFKLRSVGLREPENLDDIPGEREGELSQSLERALSSDEDAAEPLLDVSSIDPVQEFGFLVIGHEFDNYPKQMIRDAKTWNWFLEEPSKESTDDEGSDAQRKRKSKRKRKKSGGAENDEDDDEWTGESEDEKEVLARVRKPQGVKYKTRSKNHLRPDKDVGGSGEGVGRKRSKVEKEEEVEDEDEDEEDDTLGGFIIDDANAEEGEEEEDEEEEFDEGEDDE